MWDLQRKSDLHNIRYSLEQNYPDNDTYFHNENNSWQQCFVMKKIALLITDRV